MAGPSRTCAWVGLAAELQGVVGCCALLWLSGSGHPCRLVRRGSVHLDGPAAEAAASVGAPAAWVEECRKASDPGALEG